MELNRLSVRIARSENLPVLPQCVSSVLKLADDPNSGPREMEKVIERDPAITAKILRAANSSYYGSLSVPSVGRAISFLGMTVVRNLVVSVAFQQLVGQATSGGRFSATSYWSHSLAVATAGRIIGRLKMPVKAEELFSAGMMHDIGYLVMDRFVSSDLDCSIEAAQANGAMLHEIELNEIGFNHAEAGGLLAEKWGLTPIVSSAIRNHHDPFSDEANLQTTCIIHVADALAHQCGFENQSAGVTYELSDETKQIVGLPDEQYDSIRKVMTLEVQKAQEAYGIS
ncbi:MAG: HDOD domain-containing protein [Fimbriimonadaceae bacterium]|nr:HDOD domain-containing protein [Fimbriimonadaceae bacterium]